MATSVRKHVVPAPLETPRRQTINDLAASINDIIPVANVTARAQLLAELGWSPSPGRPLIVSRADAYAAVRVEMTTDGVNWGPVVGVAHSSTQYVVSADKSPNSAAIPGSGFSTVTVGDRLPYPTRLSVTIAATVGYDSAALDAGLHVVRDGSVSAIEPSQMIVQPVRVDAGAWAAVTHIAHIDIPPMQVWAGYLIADIAGGSGAGAYFRLGIQLTRTPILA
ncbi:hypothetical protein [Oerskovia paurometabola]|uniref:Minor tail protein n=1 Tax=Oerskovia paurometabola TaxID=162170 RepID=A0ABW1X7P2_9CELL|nr:hypothetical protein [Oerskovia paurometabola]MBM7497817.1 hypothetical protein [Oerskovia paurometabola]